MKIVFAVLLALSVFLVFGSATEIKYTPNEQDDGPLPLSQSQRQQLLQLEQAIMQSPDPQATLQQVAQANNMDPQDLVKMLERNHSDMEQAGGARRQVQAWPQQVMKIMTTTGVVVSQLAAKNPKAFYLIAFSLFSLLYISLMIPRNGVIISSGSGLLSKGHTTWWAPPTKYVDRFIDSRHFAKKEVSIKEKRLDLGDLHVKEGVEWHSKLGRKSPLASAATSQITIDINDFIPEELLEGKEQEEIDAIREEVTEVLFEQAASVISSHRLTEFTDNKVRFQSSSESRQRLGVLVIPKSGDWGRFGLQPLKIAQKSEGETYAQIKYSTLKGGLFDGQLHILTERTKKGNVIVQVNALIPKKGRKLKKAMATLVVKTITSSIERSIRTEANSLLARQMQGKRFSVQAKERAVERRQMRFEKEQKLEEMAEDRRRRWQRGNPDAGRYRPSGDRMKSPNNC